MIARDGRTGGCFPESQEVFAGYVAGPRARDRARYDAIGIVSRRVSRVLIYHLMGPRVSVTPMRPMADFPLNFFRASFKPGDKPTRLVAIDVTGTELGRLRP